MTDPRWPDADLDPIRRVRVLASAVPSAGFVETTFDVPYDELWPWLADLERSVPSFDRRVAALRVRDRRADDDGSEQLRIVARSAGVPTPFDVRLEPGFCIMRAKARIFLVVMGARPDGEGRTRYAQVEAVPLPGARPLRRLLQREVEADVAGIRRAVER
jgi:hypothetical protein